MPEILGFKEKNGKILAVISFPKARKFTLMPDKLPVLAPSSQENNQNEGHEK